MQGNDFLPEDFNDDLTENSWDLETDFGREQGFLSGETEIVNERRDFLLMGDWEGVLVALSGLEPTERVNVEFTFLMVGVLDMVLGGGGEGVPDLKWIN